MERAVDFKWLTIDREPTEAIIELLEANVLGEPQKSMRYQHQRLRPKITHIAAPYFVSVKRREQIIGMGCFCKRPSLNQGKEFNSFYIRYFSFRDGHRIAQANGQGKRVNKKSAIKEELKELLSPSGLAENQKALFYSYLDPKNERSANLCHYFGFKPIREFTTCLFSRIYPKVHPNVSNIPKYSLEKAKIKALLEAQYADYNMLSFENLFFEDNYFVLRGGSGEILAGVQANFEHWKIIEMPDRFGKIIMKVLPKLPVLNKLFNPEYRFVALSGIYVKEGHEQRLSDLFESVLGIHKLTSALLWLDVDSDLYRTVSGLPKGLMNRFYHGLTANVIANTIKLNQEEIDALTQKPAYISSFDLT